MTSGKIVAALLEQGTDDPATFLRHYESPLKLLILEEGGALQVCEDTPEARAALAAFAASEQRWAQGAGEGPEVEGADFADRDPPRIEEFLKAKGVVTFESERIILDNGEIGF